jgi:prepilin-type N-terminal cleavage/methylation domain-containing protein
MRADNLDRQLIRRGRFPRAGYTLLEMLMALLIIQMISGFVLYSVSAANNGSRLDLLSKRATGALRYARMLAMSSGKTVNVDFNLTSQTINVYLGAATTPVSNALFPGGKCSMNLKSDQGLSGTAISAVSNAPAAPVAGATAYRVTYGVLGTRTNSPSFAQPATVTFTCGSGSATLTIPNAGDPY